MKDLQEGKATLFFNKNKKENQPDFTGKCLIDSKIKDIAIWVNEKDGNKTLSIKINKEYRPDDLTDLEHK